MRINDIEFRWSDINSKHELVKWRGKVCYVIAFFELNEEGYDLRTIGERFFEDHDAWIVAKYSLKLLNEIYNELDEEDSKCTIQ